MKQIILTGDRPTGRLHVGHYVGSLKERVKLQNSGNYDEIYIMIADAQALTDNAEHPEKVRQNIMQVALDYLACDVERLDAVGVDCALSKPLCAGLLLSLSVEHLNEVAAYNLTLLLRIGYTSQIVEELL